MWGGYEVTIAKPLYNCWHWTAYRRCCIVVILAYLNGVMNRNRPTYTRPNNATDGDIFGAWALLKPWENGMMKAIFQHRILFSHDP